MTEASQALDFLGLFDLIVDSTATTTEKLLALIIGRDAVCASGGAIARAEMLRQASCSLSSFKRAHAALGAFFEAEQRRGMATKYAPRAASEAEVASALSCIRERESRGQNDATVAVDLAHSEPPLAQIEPTKVGVKMTPLIKDSRILLPRKVKGTSLRSVPSPAKAVEQPNEDMALDDMTPERIVWGQCARWLTRKTGKSDRQVKGLIGKWLKVVSHVELLGLFRGCRDAGADPIPYIAAIVARSEKALMDSCRRENGRVVAVNGFRQELESLLRGRDLQRSLDRINGNIPQHIVGVDLEARVRSEVIKLVDIEDSWAKRNRAGQFAEGQML